MERRLRNLFDFQKFERNPKLGKMISDVEKKYQVADVLSDDALEMVSAGLGHTGQNGQNGKWTGEGVHTQQDD